MRRVLKIFFTASKTNPWGVLLLLLLGGLFEGIGIASLMPFLATATNEGLEDPSQMVVFFYDVLAVVGLQPDVGVLLCIIVGGIVLKCVFLLFAMKHVGYTVAGVSTGLREQLVEELINVKWKYFTHQPIGRISNVMSFDATRSGEAYLNAATTLACVIQTAVYGIVALFVSWRLALVALLVGLVITGSLGFLVRMMRKAGFKQTKRTSELTIYLSDALGGVKPLKAMAKQGEFAALFRKKIAQLRNALRKQVVSRYALLYLQEVLLAVIGGLGFYAAWSLWDLPISALLVMGLLFFQIVSSVGKAQKQYQRAVLYEAPYLAMLARIEEARAARELSEGTRPPAFSHEIRLDRVSFSHDKQPVLQDASLLVPAGEITVLTGHSGAGKTTVVDLIVGLHRPDSGKVLIDGVSLSDIDLAAWRSMVGYVPQELVLFHDSIRANITLGDPEVGEEDVAEALAAAGAADFVAALPEGLDTIVGEKGTKLSGGQRQRISLARALVTKPKLLILDEVTSALDPSAELDICTRISALSKSMTILAITHRQAWIDIADRVCNVHDRSIELTALPEAAATSS